MMPPDYFFDYREVLAETRFKLRRYCKPLDLGVNYTFETSEEYSLPYTLLSSYACYFFAPHRENGEIHPYHWVGVAQPFTGLHAIQTSEYEVRMACSEEIREDLVDYARNSLGLWRCRFEMPSHFLSLTEEYPGVRVPKLNRNMIDVLVAVLCSGHATITNGRRWFMFLETAYPEFSSLRGMDPYEVMRQSRKESGASMGYRARYVIDAISDLCQNGSPKIELEQMVKTDNPDETRRKLLSIRSIGPKTADCFLLNALGQASVPPVDVNVRRVCSRLNIFGLNIGLPNLKLCQTFQCSAGPYGCPRFEESKEILKCKMPYSAGCLRAALKQKFVDAGWVQSMLFLHGIEYCRAQNPYCHQCKLREICSGPETGAVPTLRVSRRRRAVHLPTTERLSLPELLHLYPERLERLTAKMSELNTLLLNSKYNAPRKIRYGVSMWISARQDGIPLTFEEVESFLGLRSGVLFKRIQEISQVVSVEIPRLELSCCLEAFVKKYQMTEEEKELALSLSRRAFRPGMSMFPLVGVSVLKSLEMKGRRLSMTDIAKTVRVTPVTIRKYRAIVELVMHNTE